MTATERLDALINNHFLNGKSEAFNALKLLRDDVAKLESDNAEMRASYQQWESSLAILPNQLTK